MDSFLAEVVSLLPESSIIAPAVTANAQVQVPADRAIYGEWGPVLPWPHIAVTAANLPDGRIVTFASNLRTAFPDGPEFTYAGVWDPQTGEHTEINHDSHDMFCGATAMRADGRLMISGGRSASRLASIFDHENDEWIRLEDMHDGRWYAASTTLANGSVVTASASIGTGLNTVERYDDGQGWTLLTGVPWNSVATKDFPFNFVAPDGRIFSAGPEGLMHWVDPQGIGQITQTGAVFPGARTGQSGGVLMYDVGKILFAGGGVTGGGTTNVAHVVDFNDDTPVVSAVEPMRFRRRFHNALMLPDGQAIMIGGNTSGVAFEDSGTIYAPEMWDPATDTWTELADMSIPRNYHSVALMLPDGRVFSAGGGLSYNDATNHQDAQIYSPPYLFDGDGNPASRPQIDTAPDVVLPGRTVSVTASEGISRFTLVRMTGTTHAFSSDVRFLEIPFSEVGVGEYDIELHANPNVIIPGYWMLFALDADGTPSIAKTLRIAIPSVPTIADPGLQTTAIGEPVGLQISADDADGDALVFGAGGLPPGLQIDPDSGLIYGSPLAVGQFPVVVTVGDGTNQAQVQFDWEITGVENSAPQITNPGDQVSVLGIAIDLGIVASDAQGDVLSFSGSDLPPGLVLDSVSGRISGSPTTLGVFSPTISVGDGVENDSTSFYWEIRELAAATALVPGPIEVGGLGSFGIAGGAVGSSFAWDFGDGSALVFTSETSVEHAFSLAGRYTIAVTITGPQGEVEQISFHQSVHNPLNTTSPAVSQSVVYEARVAGNDRVWNVNPDNGSVSVFDATTHEKVGELAVGEAPRCLALDPAGRIWVANKGSSTLSLIGGGSLAVESTISLPRGAQPHGLAIDPASGDAFVVLEGTGELMRIDGATGAVLDSVGVGANPRHLSISSDGSTIYVSRFVTPPVSGESGTDPQPDTGDGGELVVVSTVAGLQIEGTILLETSTRPDGLDSARGVPNYLGPAAISPDGSQAWVASKQDNIQRGSGRDGKPLIHDNTLRGITSRIDLGTASADEAERIDHDNAGIGSTTLFDRTGNLVFSALEGSRHVAVIDVYNGAEIARFKTGRAPQGLAISPDGRRLYVHNFMGRSVTVHDISRLVDGDGDTVTTLATYDAVADEQLSSLVLRGKQLFYDSEDQRLALEGYISCASCHNDGGQDGRVWDLTGFGEGLRNTIDLRGRAGIAHGPLHWSANFNEVQDFEGQIRDLAGGGGLIDPGDPHPPLGVANSGRSEDLDAIAAYVASLAEFDNSPFRQADGALSPGGEQGKLLFQSQGCASCHSGPGFTDSPSGLRHDVGTLLASSGGRLGGQLDGIDTPTLRGVWNSAPYLHDGRAGDLGEAIVAHQDLALTQSELSQLVEYLRQIDGSEPAPGAGGGDGLVADGDTVALYHFDDGYGDSSGNGLDLIVGGNVSLAEDNLGWMVSPSGAAARFRSIGDQLTVSIPDALLLPGDGPLSIDARIFVRGYLGFGVASVPIISLEQSWDTYFNFNEDIWGGPGMGANGVNVVSEQQWDAATVLGQWQRLQISYDGAGTTSVHLDGELVNSVASAPDASRDGSWTLSIGNLDADIDELMISRSEAIGQAPPIDTLAPAAGLATDSTTVGAPFSVAITFSESVSGLSANDLIVGNGIASNLIGSGANYSVTITPAVEGTVSVDLPAGTVQDAGGNANTASNTLAVAYAAPGGGGGAGGGGVGDELSADATTVALYHFNGGYGDSSGNGLDLIAGGNVSLAGDNLAWMANPSGAAVRFRNLGDQLTVSIPDALLLPGDGPLSIDARIFVRGFLGFGVASVPIISLEQSWDTFFNFNEDIWGGAGVSANAVSVVSPLQWEEAMILNQWQRLQISYDGAGTTSVFLDGALINSLASSPEAGRDGGWTLTLGNLDADIDELLISRSEANALPPVEDTVAPGVALATASSTVTAPFSVAIEFTEAVSGIGLSDLDVSNGVASVLSGGGASYSVIVTPAGEGEVTIMLPAGAALDAAGNPSLAASPLTVEYSLPAGGGGGDEANVTPDTIALYHLNNDFLDASPNGLHLAAGGGVELKSDNLGWMQSPSGTAADFSSVGDSLSVAIPDNLVLADASSPLTIEARVFVRDYLGYGVDNLPVLSLHQDWDAHFQLEDRKWGNNPAGPQLLAAGGVLASAQQWGDVVEPGVWHQLQVSYDGAGTVTCWIDDIPLSALSIEPNADRTSPWILTLGNFDGMIDEVHIQSIPAPLGYVDKGDSVLPSTPAISARDAYSERYGTSGSLGWLDDDDRDGWRNLEEIAYGSAPFGGGEPALIIGRVQIGDSGYRSISFPVETLGETTGQGYRSAAFEYLPQFSTDLEGWRAGLVPVENPADLPAPAGGYRFVSFRMPEPGQVGFFRILVRTTGG